MSDQPLHTNRYPPDDWSPDGPSLFDESKLGSIRAAADDQGIIVRHWHYRGSRAPDLRGFSDFDEFEEYVRDQSIPGDAFDIWAFSACCSSSTMLADGKKPDIDGWTPRKGAY
jgi:hypothetical protein